MNRMMAGGLEDSAVGVGGRVSVGVRLVGVSSGVGGGSVAVGRTVVVGSGRALEASVGIAVWTGVGGAHAERNSRIRTVTIRW